MKHLQLKTQMAPCGSTVKTEVTDGNDADCSANDEMSPGKARDEGLRNAPRKLRWAVIYSTQEGREDQMLKNARLELSYARPSIEGWILAVTRPESPRVHRIQCSARRPPIFTATFKQYATDCRISSNISTTRVLIISLCSLASALKLPTRHPYCQPIRLRNLISASTRRASA
jgi:hypothetical protein